MIPNVYFIKAALEEGEKAISEKGRRLFKQAGFAKCFDKNDFTAVKVHIGEHGNLTYIKAPCLKGMIDELLALKGKCFLTETSTLYIGQRHNAIDQTILAGQHGFDFNGLGLPFIVCDGLFGTSETAVKIDGELNKEVLIAYDIARVQSIFSIAHVTGHLGTNFAATLKTLGMGCASRKGKMRQHAAFKPSVDAEKCVGCGTCYRYCPEGAITLKDFKSHIDQDKCVGCAECLAVCRFEAIKHDWSRETKLLEYNVAEHAKGVLKGKEGKAAFVNFAMSITGDCDCMNLPDKRIIDDIGILGSTDPVAVDQAAIDLMEKTAGKPLNKISKYPDLNGKWQLEHAEKIGLGSRKYKLVEIES
jgi:uncharacterized Fe-S center protein